MAVEPYNLCIRHIKGSENAPADFLSRNLGRCKVDEYTEESPIIAALVMRNAGKGSLAHILREETEKDANFKLIINSLDAEEDTGKGENKPNEMCQYEYRDGLLFRIRPKGRNGRVLVVPKQCTAEILKFFHDDQGHPGFGKLIKILRDLVTWKRLARDVKSYVKTCHLCQTCKHRNATFEGRFITVIPTGKGELLYIDLLGPLVKGRWGWTYILVMVDAFSKHVRLF